MSKSDVELRLPAQSPYVSVLRMTTAGLAARFDFTLDDLEDLRIAVGEACGLLLEHADETSEFTANYELGPARIDLRVAMNSAASSPTPDHDSFGWQVLSALVDDLSDRTADGRCEISFSVTSAKA